MSATEEETIDQGAFAGDQPVVDPEPQQSPEEALADAEADLAETLEVFELDELHAPKEWTFSYANQVETFTQRPLGMVPKVEYFAYIAGVVDEAMSTTGNPLSFENVLDMMSPTSEDSMLGDAQQMMMGLLKLAVYAPDILVQSYCVWLGVPPAKREWFANAIRRPVDEGGLSDDDGFDIVARFIDQNAEAIVGFFGERMRALEKRARKRFGAAREKGASGGRSSKRSTS